VSLNIRELDDDGVMSLVLAADYQVPDFEQWWAALLGSLPRLPRLGAHHVVVYRALEDPSRVFVTMGVRERGPVDALLRSPVLFSWFDLAGVEEIPPMFVGEVVEKLDLADTAAAGDQAGAVIVAMIVPVGQVDHLRAGIHHAITRIEASGVRRFWIYRALDDPAEAMILQEIASERQARRWIRHPDAAARFMSHAGEGAYPPPFVGRLVETIEVPAPSADPQ
jgi:hypothetical protein